MRNRKTWIQLQCRPTLFDSLVILTCIQQEEGHARINTWRKRVHLLSSFDLDNRLIHMADGCQIRGIPEVRYLVAGVELERPLEFALRAGPVPKIIHSYAGESGV